MCEATKADWGIYSDSAIKLEDYSLRDNLQKFDDPDKGVVIDKWTQSMVNSITSATTSPVFIYDAGTSDRISRIEEDLREVKAMLQEIYNMGNKHHEVLELRDISRHQAKKEIASYFEDHHGETFNEADLQEALKISIWMVIDICEELEKEGKIK
jgi:hypothetical protein